MSLLPLSSSTLPHSPSQFPHPDPQGPGCACPAPAPHPHSVRLLLVSSSTPLTSLMPLCCSMILSSDSSSTFPTAHKTSDDYQPGASNSACPKPRYLFHTSAPPVCSLSAHYKRPLALQVKDSGVIFVLLPSFCLCTSNVKPNPADCL